MARSAIWRSIRQSLSADIAEGRFATGDRLPTEAQLAARFGVKRHTVRRALAEMSADGQVRTRRGSGAYVAATPTDYAIGRRVRFHQNVEAGGRSPAKKRLSVTRQAATAREAAALDIAPGAAVCVHDGLSLVDDRPVALFQSVFPAGRLPGIDAALEMAASVTRALAICGVDDYTRASTRITAEAASATQALHLRLAEGAPVLRTQSVNVDPSGSPVEFGLTWFAGDRVTLTVGET